jgi:predicted MFS family arabinose efflux permease
MGVPIGAMLGVICGGWIGQTLGWRDTLLLVGAPGIAVALIARLTLREPQRGRFDTHTPEQPPPLTAVVRGLFSERSFVHLLLGLTLATFAAAGISTFITPFVLRGDFGVNLASASLIMGPIGGAASLLGTAAGGFLTDWAGRYDKRAYFWIPGVCLLIAAPLYAAALLSSDMLHFAILSCLAQLIVILYLAPTFAVIHNMVDARMRASAIAVVYLIINLIGTGLGPVAVGWLSGHLAEWTFGGAARWNAACEGVAASGLSADCRLASFAGVKLALIGATAFYLWGALHYFLAGARLNSSPKAMPA